MTVVAIIAAAAVGFLIGGSACMTLVETDHDDLSRFELCLIWIFERCRLR